MGASVVRDTLPDGSIRLASDRCTFLFHRPRAGVVLATIVGNDTGAFGDATLAEFDAEIARAGSIALFIDAREATGIATAVRERWTAWFQASEPRTRRVVVLSGSRFIELTVTATKLFSNTGDLIRVTADERAFVDAIAQEVPGFSALPSRAGRRARPGAHPVTRAVLSDGSLRLSTPGCAHVLATPRPGVARVTITGDDVSAFTDMTLDALEAEIGRHRPIHLFFDLRDTTAITPAVPNAWIAWLLAHQQDLAGVHFLVSTAFVERLVSLSKVLLGKRRLTEIHTDARAFEAELARVVAAPVR
ncbi:MAG: hypothetical protein QM820_01370 [Minicystis sp.]